MRYYAYHTDKWVIEHTFCYWMKPPIAEFSCIHKSVPFETGQKFKIKLVTTNSKLTVDYLLKIRNNFFFGYEMKELLQNVHKDRNVKDKMKGQQL